MDYQSNSKKSKQDKPPEKKVERVVTGEVVVKQPSVSTRFKNIFFGGDFHTASEYVVSQVLLPALRNLIVESISRGTDRLIYGDSINRPPSRPSIGTTGYAPRVQYNNPVSRQGAGGSTYSPKPPWQVSAPGRRAFEDVTFGAKEDAEAVIEAMITIVDQYDIVSVADLNELIGMPSAHTDHKWGWGNLASIQLNQTKDGWTVTFPPVEEI